MTAFPLWISRLDLPALVRCGYNSGRMYSRTKAISTLAEHRYTTRGRTNQIIHQQVQYTIFANPNPIYQQAVSRARSHMFGSSKLRGTSPQRLHPRTPRHQPTQPHPPQIPPGHTPRRIRKVQRHRQPRTRNHRIRPPPLIKLGILLILVFRNRPPISQHLLPRCAALRLHLPLAAEAQKVAGHAAKPGTVGPDIQACGSGAAAVYARDEGGRDDAGVGEQAHVFQRLVGGVATRL